MARGTCTVGVCEEMLTKQRALHNILSNSFKLLCLLFAVDVDDVHCESLTGISPGATVGGPHQRSQCYSCGTLPYYVEQCVQCHHPGTDHSSVATFFVFGQATSPVSHVIVNYHNLLWSFAATVPI